MRSETQECSPGCAPANAVGQSAARARELLEDAGWEIVQIEETGPPAKSRQPAGLLRVVQQRQVGPGRVRLVVARQINLSNR